MTFLPKFAQDHPLPQTKLKTDFVLPIECRIFFLFSKYFSSEPKLSRLYAFFVQTKHIKVGFFLGITKELLTVRRINSSPTLSPSPCRYHSVRLLSYKNLLLFLRNFRESTLELITTRLW